MPMSGVYVLRPSGQQARVLEHQLRCCRFLRQMGLLRARVVVVADELLPQQAAALQAIARQALADEIVCLEDLRTRMAEELK